MSSNVEYTICPECSALNAAMWNQHGLQSYDVACTVCGHEYERGRFASDGVRLLVHQIPLPDDTDGLLALTPEQIEEIIHGRFVGIYRQYFWEEI